MKSKGLSRVWTLLSGLFGRRQAPVTAEPVDDIKWGPVSEEDRTKARETWEKDSSRATGARPELVRRRARRTIGR